ncbi:hypothetical protein EJB05_23129, partial [Eragrostis curvula]
MAADRETVAGLHVLRIDNFSATKDLGVGKEIVSSTFRVAGHNWCIKCYPCGDDEDSAGWVSLSLVFDPFLAMDEVQAECRFTLMDCVTVGEPVPSELLCLHTFSSTDDSLYTEFIERNKLESSHLKGDCFQVRCEVRVIKEFPPIPPPELHRHLGDLLASQVGGDVTFKIGDELFTAHRCVLAARSSVFMADLCDPGKDTMAQVLIDNMEPKVFKALLHFIYANELTGIDDDNKIKMVQHLLVAANRYDIPRLKCICEEILYNSVDESTAATTLRLAEKHGCRRLKEACVTLLKNLLASVQGSEGDTCSLASTTRKKQRSG